MTKKFDCYSVLIVLEYTLFYLFIFYKTLFYTTFSGILPLEDIVPNLTDSCYAASAMVAAVIRLGKQVFRRFVIDVSL